MGKINKKLKMSIEGSFVHEKIMNECSLRNVNQYLDRMKRKERLNRSSTKDPWMEIHKILGKKFLKFDRGSFNSTPSTTRSEILLDEFMNSFNSKSTINVEKFSLIRKSNLTLTDIERRSIRS